MVLEQKNKKVLKAEGKRRFWKNGRQGDET